MKYDIIHLNGFMYAVDKPTKNIINGHFMHPKNVIFPVTNKYIQGPISTSLMRPIVATNNPDLGLPLLPDVEENSRVFECILAKTGEKVWKFYYSDLEGFNQHSGVYFSEEDAIKGLKDFKAKQFTEEDMRNAMEHISHRGYWIHQDSKKRLKRELDNYLDSLKSKPAAVELEMGLNRYMIAEGEDSVTEYLKIDSTNHVIVKQWYYE